MSEVLRDITQGKGRQEHIDFLQDMAEAVKDTALCGLGNTAPNPILTTIRYFLDEYQAHIKDRTCSAHVCLEFLKFEIIKDNCVKCGQCYKACPVEAVTWKKKEYPKIDKDKCIKCKSCINACQFMAIQ